MITSEERAALKKANKRVGSRAGDRECSRLRREAKRKKATSEPGPIATEPEPIAMQPAAEPAGTKTQEKKAYGRASKANR